MHPLRTTAFLRTSNALSSTLPAPVPIRSDSDSSAEAQSALTRGRLSLGNFSGRKSSQMPMSPAPLVQDGSYLESLSLKLSEAVSKALAQPASTVAGPDVLYGKRPISATGGRVLGELVATEFNASQGKTHLQRAILRVLHKPFSVLITNLSSMLLPLLSSPAFLSPSAPTIQQPGPNATQLHALAVAEFAVELSDSLDGLSVEVLHDHKADGLHSFREGLRSIIGRVMNPLVCGIKSELIRLLDALERSGNATSVAAQSKSTGGSKTMQHPSIASLQTLTPVYTKALKRYTAPKCMQSSLAALLISSVWHALVALSHRPTISSNSLSGTTALKKRLAAPMTPPSSPPPTRFTMKLPGSRPPSPTFQTPPSTASDVRTVYDLLSLLPKPAATADDESSHLAREAVEEAFESLAVLTALLGTFDHDKAACQPETRGDLDIDSLTDGVPVLIALPVLLRWSGNGEPQTIPAMLGISEGEYRTGCLSGFGRADECAVTAAQRMLRALRGACDEACGAAGAGDQKTKMVMHYLEGCHIH